MERIIDRVSLDVLDARIKDTTENMAMVRVRIKTETNQLLVEQKRFADRVEKFNAHIGKLEDALKVHEQRYEHLVKEREVIAPPAVVAPVVAPPTKESKESKKVKAKQIKEEQAKEEAKEEEISILESAIENPPLPSREGGDDAPVENPDVVALRAKIRSVLGGENVDPTVVEHVLQKQLRKLKEAEE